MSIDRATSATGEDDPLPAAGENTDRSVERTASRQAGPDDGRVDQRAETRTREEYDDARRAGGGPMSPDDSQDSREAPEEEPRGQPERQADHDQAEPRDRETYADEVRAGRSADEHQGQAAETPKLTDADWSGTSRPPDGNEMASSGERPESDQPDGRVFDADKTAASGHDREEADHQPETVTFDNKDIEVTHNTADGLWIEGLPGEPPTRIGDLVQSAEDPAQGRAEKLRAEFNKEAENITDTGGKWADYFQEILDNPRPTHAMTHSRTPETAISGAEHGINAGHGAEAFLTLAIVGAAALHKLHERWQRSWEH